MLELKSGVMPKLGVHLCILIWIWLTERIEMTNVGKSQNTCFLLLSNCTYALLIGGFVYLLPRSASSSSDEETTKKKKGSRSHLSSDEDKRRKKKKVKSLKKKSKKNKREHGKHHKKKLKKKQESSSSSSSSSESSDSDWDVAALRNNIYASAYE